MRLDQYLTHKGFLPSREKAKEWIKSGRVFVNDIQAKKSSLDISSKDSIKISEELKFVSRAGYKLEKAILEFNIDCKNKICLDIGSSTGGFVDCLLQNGAKKVYALEISKGELSDKLSKDNRVINMEGTDVRSNFILPEKIDIASADCTFLSLKEIIPISKKYLKKEGILIALIKPPFEISRHSGKMKVFSGHEKIIDELKKYSSELGFFFIGSTKSPLLGKAAKQEEYLLVIKNEN